MEICNRPGLDKMVVTSNNLQHQQQHINRLQEQPDEFQPPAGTGKSAPFSQPVFDFDISIRFAQQSSDVVQQSFKV
jgi:hypothetical protein